MTNAPEDRKTHVARLVGTNRNGDVLNDMWVDVERVDEFEITTQTSSPELNIENQWQEVQIKLRWRDDPNGKNYSPEDDLSSDDEDNGRVHEIIKICDPQNTADLTDPDEWVPVKSIVRINMNQQGAGDSQKRFVASAVEAKGREVDPRRFYHYDTNIDSAAQAAFDHGARAFVVKGSNYQRDDSTKDVGQYVEHEIIDHLIKNINDQTYSTGGDNQEVQLGLKNQYLIDESDPAKLDKVGPNNINPPYRLDPFQNIVNVKLSSDAIVVFLNSDGLGGQLDLELLIDVKMIKDTSEIYFFDGDFFGTAYRVSPAGKSPFVKMKLHGDSGATVSAYVFATNSDRDHGMQRAIDGATAIRRAPDIVAGDKLGPEGLLWSVTLFGYPASAVVNWKLRRGEHRRDKNPQNIIVQCYPLGVAPSHIDAPSCST